MNHKGHTPALAVPGKNTKENQDRGTESPLLAEHPRREQGESYAEGKMTTESLLWQVRAFVYNHFADTTGPPSVADTARHFNIGIEEASALYKELHNRHAFFLDPETLTIRMANPFSGIPTDYKVHANGKTYFANCAWDMLGIPAALASSNDAVIEAICTESDDRVQLAVRDGQIQAHAAVPGGENKSSLASDLKIHFPLPFARWYDDLLFT